ncbi:MAG TPA: CBASS cGAMP-activated phospholipase [Chitinophagales bacterium]|nr:CBASS cGAMP-activated phospholipase [Chitinophagales bacterium]
MNSKFKILSIDGGGIRGIIPAVVLSEIEKRAQQPISSLFDLIAGTSTGGVIALGLGVPDEKGFPKFSADDLVGLYEKNGSKIFNKPRTLLLNWVKKAASFFNEAYSKKGIEKVLQNYFGNAELRDLLTDSLITAYEIEKRKPFYFLSRLAKDPEHAAQENFKVAHIARSTSAAPTYFEPSWIDWKSNSHLALVDGGVFANNPSMLAFTEAQELLKKTGAKAMDPVLTASDKDQPIFMLSLGTGNSLKSYKYAKAKGWGKAGWLTPLIDILMQGVSESVHYQMQYVLPPDRDGTLNYFRMNTTIEAKDSKMDDASHKNIKALKNYGKKIIEDYSSAIDTICSCLTH